MNFTSFIFLLAGWIAVALAVFALISHASPALDIIHMRFNFGATTQVWGMIPHLAMAIFLGGLAYLLINAANRM